MSVYYMHTINGHPAVFDGEQVCYMRHYGRPNVLATSLKQIRDEHRRSAESRKAMGFRSGDYNYGYHRVSPPPPSGEGGK